MEKIINTGFSDFLDVLKNKNLKLFAVVCTVPNDMPSTHAVDNIKKIEDEYKDLCFFYNFVLDDSLGVEESQIISVPTLLIYKDNELVKKIGGNLEPYDYKQIFENEVFKDF